MGLKVFNGAKSLFEVTVRLSLKYILERIERYMTVTKCNFAIFLALQNQGFQ